jgi:hypothetical protein
VADPRLAKCISIGVFAKLVTDFMEDCDVLIVGGGITGIYLASLLEKQKSGKKVIVVEALPRLGGRLLEFNTEKASFDLGGQFLSTQHSRALGLLKELGFYTRSVAGGHLLKLLQCQLGASSQSYADIPPLNPISLFEVQCFLWRCNSIARGCLPEVSHSAFDQSICLSD